MHSHKRSAACSALAIAILGCSAQLVAGVLPRSLAFLDLVEETTSVFTLPHDISGGMGILPNISDRGSNMENMEPGRIGTPFQFSIPVDVVKIGEATQVEEGTIIRSRVDSKGADSISLEFGYVDLCSACEIFVYPSAHPSQDRSVQHFTRFKHGNGEPRKDKRILVPPVKGDSVTVEVFIPSGNDAVVTLVQAVHNFMAIPGVHGSVDMDLKVFDAADDCHLNVACYPEYESERRAIVLTYLNGVICSGAFINNLVGKQLLLTAKHCIQSNPAGMILFFHAEMESCESELVSENFAYTSGAELVADSPDSDFAILEITTPIPSSFNVYYLGWDASTSPASGVVGIHHPKGDLKRISFANDPIATKKFYPNLWSVYWSEGVTAKGSSGSPLLNMDTGRIVGQLFGGKSFCDSPYEEDWYGKFDVSFSIPGMAEILLGEDGPETLYIDGCDGAPSCEESVPEDIPEVSEPVPPPKCLGQCGQSQKDCFCDDLCTYFKDCCFDYYDYCAESPPPLPPSSPPPPSPPLPSPPPLSPPPLSPPPLSPPSPPPLSRPPPSLPPPSPSPPSPPPSSPPPLSPPPSPPPSSPPPLSPPPSPPPSSPPPLSPPPSPPPLSPPPSPPPLSPPPPSPSLPPSLSPSPPHLPSSPLSHLPPLVSLYPFPENTSLEIITLCLSKTIIVMTSDKYVGTNEDECIFGTEGPDTIVAKGGNDIVFGLGGSDNISGDEGNDIIFLGDGDDIGRGGSEDDTIYGGSGDDDIVGDKGNDLIYGDDGNDNISGNANDDILYGGKGDDILKGVGNDDIVYGDDGNDEIWGGGGNDFLMGGNGDDHLKGGLGDDVLYADQGTDKVLGNGGSDITYIVGPDCGSHDIKTAKGDQGEDGKLVYVLGAPDGPQFMDCGH